MIELNGISWYIKFVPALSEIFRMPNGDFTVGVCDSDTRTIYLDENLYGSKLKKVVIHELVHASMSSYSVSLTRDQEELIADLLATYGEEIISKANLIFDKLKGRDFY